MPAAITQGWSDGIQKLNYVNKLLIKQKVDLLELFVGFESKNKYTIINGVGEEVFYAIENNGCLVRNCCGKARPFKMKIFDQYRNEIIRLSRPLRCQSCCCPCCLQRIEVFSPPGRLVGSVDQEWSICCPSFAVRNAANEEVFKIKEIKGQICSFPLCSHDNFKIISKDTSTEVGRISKQWSGLLREAFTDADHFGISFPMGLDVRMKAVMIGACFLIDFMFFEKSCDEDCNPE
ncbi:phospholipid scramblase 1-like [Adelges cooleyi]|uniref:phospholipid scramblase 1-like n=1 Tax=Adelges cooleyi TaxID=133065 RepID=UPI0021805ABC|nr:phospholipid scramblase 1-like [Adelges cooleyi]